MLKNFNWGQLFLFIDFFFLNYYLKSQFHFITNLKFFILIDFVMGMIVKKIN